MAQLMEHMKKDHEREDFVHTESNTYRSHFIVQSSDFTREIMWISDHIVLGNFTQNIKYWQARHCKKNQLKKVEQNEDCFFAEDFHFSEDRHFFRECCRSKDGQWFVWVYMIGSRKECEEYIYTVKIMSDDRVSL